MKSNQLYKIIPELKLIIECYIGEITIENIIELKQELLKDKEFNPNYFSIIDSTQAKFFIKEEAFEKCKDFINVNEMLTAKKKTAFFTDTPEQYVMSHFYKESLSEFPIVFQIFTTINAILRWLEIPTYQWDYVKDIINQLTIETQNQEQ